MTHQTLSPITQPTTRRQFLRALLGLTLASAATVGYGRTVEPRWLALEKVTLPIERLPGSLEGLRIAHLSDIHLGPYVSQAHLAHAVAAVHAADAHWLVLTGDYVTHSVHYVEELVEPLKALDIPRVAVLGNHDIWTRAATVRKALTASGTTLLRNSAVAAAPGLWFAGVDDVWSGRPDVHTALRDIPSQATTILLAHEPDYFDHVLALEAPIAAQLSGHSHGGQVRLPRLWPDAAGYHSFAPILPRYGVCYPIGLRTINGRHIYTNRGLGLWPIPFRINCRPELTLYTLQRA